MFDKFKNLGSFINDYESEITEFKFQDGVVYFEFSGDVSSFSDLNIDFTFQKKQNKYFISVDFRTA
jgi:hypothetical protein